MNRSVLPLFGALERARLWPDSSVKLKSLLLVRQGPTSHLPLHRQTTDYRLQTYGTQTFHVLSVNFGSAAVGRTDLQYYCAKKMALAVVGASLAS